MAVGMVMTNDATSVNLTAGRVDSLLCWTLGDYMQ